MGCLNFIKTAAMTPSVFSCVDMAARLRCFKVRKTHYNDQSTLCV